MTVVLGDFEWDDRKASINLRKHGVAFEEAVTAMADPAAITAPDLFERGKYAAKAAKASALLRILEPELAQRFPDSRSVNAALRALSALQEVLPPQRSRRRRAA